MIIGRGLLASAMNTKHHRDSDHIIFAAGVSNSQETRSSEFDREEKMLTDFVECQKTFVYFSTCSVDDPELLASPYVAHKKRMEQLVKNSIKHIIFRLPQVVGRSKNTHTLTNFLFNQISSDQSFQVWINAKRSLIDVDDVASICGHLLVNPALENQTINIAPPSSMRVLDIVKIFEDVLGKKAKISLVNSGGDYAIESTLSSIAANELKIKFDQNYYYRVIQKYYG